jgi:hypothetical protein
MTEQANFLYRICHDCRRWTGARPSGRSEAGAARRYVIPRRLRWRKWLLGQTPSWSSAARPHGSTGRARTCSAEQPSRTRPTTVLRDPAGPRLLLVRGERGIGRTVFAHATAERLRAGGIAVLPVACVPGDGEHPQLLALRLVMALEEHRSATTKRTHPTHSAHAAGRREALSAMKHGDRTAMAEALAAALARPTPAVVLVDDAHHADAESLALLDEVDFDRVPPGIRLLLTAARHTAPARRSPSPVQPPLRAPRPPAASWTASPTTGRHTRSLSRASPWRTPPPWWRSACGRHPTPT